MPLRQRMYAASIDSTADPHLRQHRRYYYHLHCNVRGYACQFGKPRTRYKK
jgi:hypothetical protein